MKKILSKNKIFIRVALLAPLVLLVLFLLTRCGNQRQRYDIILLQQMQKNNNRLNELFLRKDICSEDWIQEYQDVLGSFSRYQYDGTNKDIQKLVQDYKYLSIQLDELGVFIQKKQLNQALKKLEELQQLLEQSEKRVDRLK